LSRHPPRTTGTGRLKYSPRSDIARPYPNRPAPGPNPKPDKLVDEASNSHASPSSSLSQLNIRQFSRKSSHQFHRWIEAKASPTKCARRSLETVWPFSRPISKRWIGSAHERQAISSRIAHALRRGLSLVELEERYREENLRKALY
ncbi:MAG TPA: hypothetical protein VEF72_22670, partial [Mycobacterium sp.]|nr:hypothetical protein [Mycobacterium sp.]